MKVANAPISWGVIEFGPESDRLDFGQVLDDIAESGYAGTELGDWGFLPTNPAELRAELEARGLSLVGGFVPVELAQPESTDQSVERALRTADLLAAAADQKPLLILSDDNGKDEVRTRFAGRVGPEHGLNDDQWKQAASTVAQIAQRVADETGLRTVVHHHCAGYIETPWEVERILSITPPDLVGLCLDTGHFTFAGGDPISAIQNYRMRIWHVHFKDCQPKVAARSRRESWDYFTSVRRGVFCELGEGEVDFRRIIDALGGIGYAGWVVVEQDILPDMETTPKQSARRNREYLRSLGV